ncbi:hypothetical protein [Roseivirga sp.]|uniref:hypothetical protein n=1 Tax=Roseivirga sp. TaxID=1964215 RepID=UPI003B52A2C3
MTTTLVALTEHYDQFMNFKHRVMKKNLFAIILILMVSSAKAQWTDNGNNLTTTDNVGIGSANPLSKLQVNSYTGSGTAYSFGSITSFANSGDIGLYLGVANENIGARGWGFSVRSVGVNSSLDLIEKGLDGTRMTIASGGYIGVGTTNPKAKFHVNNGMFLVGNASYNSLVEQIRIGRYDNPDIRYHSIYSNHAAAPDNSYLQFRIHDASDLTSQRTVLTITGGGRVGIGTTTPDKELSVNGTIHAKKIKVDINDWPDFVFQNNYQLPTLQEIETHIAEKGHLPGIPSESEVIEKGINLGEIDAKLLQKIEELTLYLIEQNKQNQAQQVKIEQLEKELKALKQK